MLTSTRTWFVGVALITFGGCSNEDLGPIGVSPTPSTTATPSPIPTATPVLLTNDAVLEKGAAGIGVTTVVYEDGSRPTMANRTYPGSPTRRLVTEIWYPTSATTSAVPMRDAALAAVGRPFPLVMYSHGFASFRTEGGTLARHLASYGYIVVAPDFPLTNLLAPGGPNEADVTEQPLDVRFLLDQVLARSSDAEDEWFGAIDAERIGVAGLSLGGLTTLLTAFDPVLRDPRVRTVAAIAPAACPLTEEFFHTTQLPLLILAGDIDAILPYEQNARAAYACAQPPKYLVTIHGGTHTGFADAGAAFERENNADYASCTALAGGGSDDMQLDAFIEGSAAGTEPADCPPRCSGPRPLPRGIRPSRQRLLRVLTVFPFLQATLRGDDSARRFVEETLVQENAELAVQFEGA